MTTRLAPTRANLLRTRARLQRVERGVSVLRRRREALVRELFHAARPAADARLRLAEQAASAGRALVAAAAEHGEVGLDAMTRPAREVEISLDTRMVWGVAVADLTERSSLRRNLVERGTAPLSTGPAAALAADGFEELAELLLEAAPREMMLRRLGHVLARTSRQLHQLEHRETPQLIGEIARVQAELNADGL